MNTEYDAIEADMEYSSEDRAEAIYVDGLIEKEQEDKMLANNQAWSSVSTVCDLLRKNGRDQLATQVARAMDEIIEEPPF